MAHRCFGRPVLRRLVHRENPSLGQVERAVTPTPESQRLVSRGDRLFRDMLVKHGFKEGPWDLPGGWRCYLTDVIKSADRAGQWAKTPRAVQLATVEASAPVLRCELETGRPRLVVTLGKPAARFLDHLAHRGHLPPLPSRVALPHYSYIAMRAQGKLGPMHPERIAAYDALFAEVATRVASAVE